MKIHGKKSQKIFYFPCMLCIIQTVSVGGRRAGLHPVHLCVLRVWHSEATQHELNKLV